MQTNDSIKIDSSAVIWLERESSIHLKFTDSKDDPKGLSKDDARCLAKALLQVVKKLQAK